MDKELEAKDVVVGYHPEGYRIDKTAAPMNRYTRWEIRSGQTWCHPKAVCFHSLPEKGWIAVDGFDWEQD